MKRSTLKSIGWWSLLFVAFAAWETLGDMVVKPFIRGLLAK